MQSTIQESYAVLQQLLFTGEIGKTDIFKWILVERIKLHVVCLYLKKKKKKKLEMSWVIITGKITAAIYYFAD